MSYRKSTVISGYKQDHEFKTLMLHGHWNISSAIKRGRKSGLVDSFGIEHKIFDNSGHGRGGHDGRWVIDADNNARKVADWSEYGKEHNNDH